ncbi:MAG TPA: glycosyltransferase family 2 protein [Candidatus Saccharimonadales bacterium]|nr:glycosyltransferase family 2 protein [Candidatus Saccharimonadales bacterium]
MAGKGFSVVIPTYTGKDQIADCLKHVIEQSWRPKEHEVIVVVDGSEAVLQEVNGMEGAFKNRKVSFKVIFNEHNMGHFQARLIGAEATKYDQILFVDDRVKLDKDFFAYLEKTGEEAIMPNVIELETTNVISMTLNMLRSRIYGRKWGAKHTDYYLDAENFENSPKGTTSLYIKKQVFLKACDEVKKGVKGAGFSHVSDDTKVLERVVDSGVRILRPGNLSVYYSPRSGFKEAWLHLFRRGPKFVDYYHKPGTRFFPLLVLVYLVVALVLTLAIFYPVGLLYLFLASLAGVILSAAVIATDPRRFLVALIGLPLTVATFSAGILTGTLLKMIGR